MTNPTLVQQYEDTLRENVRLRAERETAINSGMLLQAAVDLLRGLLRDAPVLVIDVKTAAERGETEMLAYAKSLAEWHPRVKTIIRRANRQGLAMTMAEDVTKRLRGIAVTLGLPWPPEYRQQVFDTAQEAAAEIERLRAALQSIITKGEDLSVEDYDFGTEAVRIARRAIEQVAE